MKLIFSLFLICSHLIIFGQNTEALVQKPYLILRGNLNLDYNIDKSKFRTIEGAFPFESRYINSDIVCSIGKSISNRMELGLQFSYSISFDAESQNFFDYSRIYWDLGIYNRFTINHNPKIKFYLRPSFSWFHSATNTFSNRIIKYNSFTISAIPEVSYAISPRINLVGSLGNINYNFHRSKKNNETEIIDDFYANFNMSSLTIGGELLFFHDKQEYELDTNRLNKKFLLGFDAYVKIYNDDDFNKSIRTQTSFDRYSFLRAKGGSTFSFHPYIGKIISKRWLAGIIFDYTKLNFDVNDFSNNYHTNQHKFGLGLFARYTIHPNRKLKFLLDASTMYNSLNIKRTFEIITNFMDDTKYNYLESILTPKLSYNIKNQFNITMSIGNLSYLSSLNSPQGNLELSPISESKINETYHFNVNYGISDMRFGLEYTFGTKE